VLGLAQRQVRVAADGSESIKWRVESTASSSRIWDHAVVPEGTDPRIRALEWLALAPALHRPVDPAAVLAMQEKLEKVLDNDNFDRKTLGL
jgi:hypothetical protein